MIHNLKIYKKYKDFYKNKILHRLKFSKLIKLILPVSTVMCVTTIFSGCVTDQAKSFSKDESIDNNNPIFDNDSSSNFSNSSTSDIENDKYVIEEPDHDSQLIYDNVRFNEFQLDELDESINAIKTEYAYSDLYDVEAAYNKYQEMEYYDASSIIPSLTFYHDNKIDANTLYNVILDNNKQYLLDNEFSTYEEMDSDFIKHVCEIIASTINKELETNTFSTNLDDLLLNLNDLKIFKSLTLTNAYITDDNCLTFSPTGIDAMESITGYDFVQDIIISHETEHLIQKLSTETREKQKITRGYGYNVEFEDLEVNSLYHNWLIEASAENLATDLYDVDPITYKTKVGYLNSLTFTQILKNDFKVRDIERLTQQQSLSKVFDTFGCDSDDEKIELLNLLAAINILQEEPEDFMNLYKEKILNKADITESELVDLKVNLKNGICTTLSKYFYENLASKIYEDGLDARDIYALISIFEMDLGGHISYFDQNGYEARREFFENYVTIQDQFFDIMGQSLGYSGEEIEKSYQSYNASIEVKVDTMFSSAEYDDIIISNLSDEKNQFITEMFKQYINIKTLSIDEVDKNNAKFK